jgi:hypothetical protein
MWRSTADNTYTGKGGLRPGACDGKIGTDYLVAIIIIGAWIPAVAWGEALVWISVIAVPWGIRSVTRIPARTVSAMVSPPRPTIIPILVIPIAPTVSPPGAMIIPAIAMPMAITMAVLMAR